MSTSASRGQAAEESFIKAVRRLGYSPIKSSRNEDMFEHWDYLVADERVEVKAMKRLRRHDTEVNNDLIYVEFKNVRGNPGWIYGKADFVAFERPDSFFVIRREDLVGVAERLIVGDFTKRPQVYHKYKRRDRPDECVGLIRFGDMEPFIYRSILKADQ